MKTLKTILLLALTVNLNAVELNTLKIGGTIVPNRLGLGLTTRINDFYFGYEHGSYLDIITLNKYSAQYIIVTNEKRHFFIGLSYNEISKVESIVPTSDRSKIGFDFGSSVDIKNRSEILASIGVFKSEDYLSFEIKVGFLFGYNKKQ
jgi:hypothetical protein